VGNADPSNCSQNTFTDHPHTRGERVGSVTRRRGSSGSSPHAWGTLVFVYRPGVFSRIIPTRVGNAGSGRCCGTMFADHPHTRGERVFDQQITIFKTGSSPHAWGTRGPRRSPPPGSRIIPTRVGNAVSVLYRLPSMTDHPHTRGERSTSPFSGASGAGSSPHAWGTRHGLVRLGPPCRIIPTRVGNATVVGKPPEWFADHPHTRGERGYFAYIELMSGGSSPHAWGTHCSATPALPSRRIIPTRVGNARDGPS